MWMACSRQAWSRTCSIAIWPCWRACLGDEGVWTTRGAVTALPAADLAERECANATETPLPLALLHELVLQRARSQADAGGVQQGDASMSFGELARRAGAIAQAIRSQTEVKPGEMIAVSLPQGPELIARHFGRADCRRRLCRDRPDLARRAPSEPVAPLRRARAAEPRRHPPARNARGAAAH
ncbi:AMP-binding protein [Chromobacterium paludis]|uniref:AMP-binding protein n=1 Tax=Chromobacterium paludis TaxID=2605945 RepID=A0A5C1DMP5_9NEIS|nr:AMP-binding protein [Chromobacterium paludis]